MGETRSLHALLAAWAAAVADRPGAPRPPDYAGPDVALNALVEHTDDVAPGAAFVARVRAGSDGHAYIGSALARGAALILAQRPAAEVGVSLPSHVVYLTVPDTAVALAWLAAAWHDFSSRRLTVVGVTGTDGKTTTANLLFSILRAAGRPAGMVTTIKAVFGDADEPTGLHVTTPEAPAVQGYLRRMVDAGLTHCILEVTSHGLAQFRVAAIDFDVAVVTNVTHEHLDYHGDYAGYLATKGRLVDWTVARPGGAAVLNRDDRSYDYLASRTFERRFVYSIPAPGARAPAGDTTATDIVYGADETRFTLHLPGERGRAVTTSLVGAFNVYNMLAAATAARALPAPIGAEEIVAGLSAVSAISGRMERIDRGQDFLVVVDFAHTPNALANAIAAARGMIDADRGRVIAVFGSAGKRDVEKRRLMAEISAREADLTVLTAEDPRTESLDEILAMMADGCRRFEGVEGESFWRVPDRGRAIYHALTLARPADIVIVCGKGHEQSMCFGVVEYPWDDRDATRAALDAFLAGDPMPSLGLPTF